MHDMVKKLLTHSLMTSVWGTIKFMHCILSNLRCTLKLIFISPSLPHVAKTDE